MRKRLIRLAGILTSIVVFGGIVVAVIGREDTLVMVFGPVERTTVSFPALVPSGRPNWYLVCPEAYCRATPNRISPRYDMTAVALRERWMRMIKEVANVTQIRQDEDNLQYDFVHRSPTLRFPDTITVQFIALDDNHSTLAVYSRSHYGYSDFGANRGRVEAWLAAL